MRGPSTNEHHHVAPRTAASETVHSSTAAQRRLTLFALALGGFGIGCSEFVSMGLLPQLAEGLLPAQMAADPEIGIAQAGHAISAYAAGVVVGAPTLALFAVRMSRRRMILVFALVLAVATALSGLMPGFGLTVAARFVAGLPHGGYLGVAALIASTLMGPGSQGRGAALALSGLTVANLAGVPLLTALGQAAGWRSAYLLIALVFMGAALLLHRLVPRDPRPEGRRIVDELRALRRIQLWAIILIASIGFSGSFTVFSYIADIARGVAGADLSYVPWLLALAGAGMTIGNALGGILADRSLFGTLLGLFPLYILTMVGLILGADSVLGLTLGFMAVNLVHAALNPAMQSWLMQVAGRSEMLGASLHHASFNIANALGALLGGAVIAAGHGLAAPTVAGAAVATTGYLLLLAVLIALRLRARRRLAQLTRAGIAMVAPQRQERRSRR